MEMIGTTALEGVPWPELLPDGRPVLVVPAAPGRPLPAGDGWAGPEGADPAADPMPGWSAVLDGERLTVRRPDGSLWFDGPLAADRQWRRRVRDHRALLLVTGPFASVFDLRPAAEAGRLLLLTVPARLLADL